ncbi:LysM peptidoglycan-binding domain-containing protein [Puniceicoccaceae bacterium K14]|nr:LysM peptidoglycan-binding domain-containing protein [Puniceicoccaceae bacterium K14]
MKWITHSLIFLGIVSFLSIKTFAQSSNSAHQLANLGEDISLLNENLESLRFEIEEIRRENAELRKQVKNYKEQSESQLTSLVSITQLERVLEDLKARDAETKKEVLATVNKSMEYLLQEISTVLGSTNNSSDTPVEMPEWHTNFPDTVAVYHVKNGDTLSSIAVAHNSKVEWIRHANKIVDVRLIQLGQQLLIPIEQ